MIVPQTIFLPVRKRKWVKNGVCAKRANWGCVNLGMRIRLVHLILLEDKLCIIWEKNRTTNVSGPSVNCCFIQRSDSVDPSCMPTYDMKRLEVAELFYLDGLRRIWMSGTVIRTWEESHASSCLYDLHVQYTWRIIWAVEICIQEVPGWSFGKKREFSYSSQFYSGKYQAVPSNRLWQLPRPCLFIIVIILFLFLAISVVDVVS